jgi:hypothetical protein
MTRRAFSNSKSNSAAVFSLGTGSKALAPALLSKGSIRLGPGIGLGATNWLLRASYRSTANRAKMSFVCVTNLSTILAYRKKNQFVFWDFTFDFSAFGILGKITASDGADHPGRGFREALSSSAPSVIEGFVMRSFSSCAGADLPGSKIFGEAAHVFRR